MARVWASGAYGYLSDYLWWWIVSASLIAHTWCFFRFFPRNRKPTVRLILGNTLVLCVLLSIAGLIGESYVRFLVVETDSYGASLVSKRWFQIYPQLNSIYCRDKEWTEGRRPGVYRIAFVGDSFTYGWGINDVRDRFTDLIQSRFEARKPGIVEVMNVAWSGWGTREHIGAVHDMIQDYAVDEIVLIHVPNDIESLLPVSAGFDPKLPAKSIYINVEHSFLLNYLYYRIMAPRTTHVLSYWDWLIAGYEDPSLWAKQETQFERLLGLVRTGDVKLRVVLLPFLRTGAGRFDQGMVQARVGGYFASKSIPVIDLLPNLTSQDPAGLVVNPHDSHPNGAAHRIIAEAIWGAFYASGDALRGVPPNSP